MIKIHYHSRESQFLWVCLNVIKLSFIIFLEKLICSIHLYLFKHWLAIQNLTKSNYKKPYLKSHYQYSFSFKQWINI